MTKLDSSAALADPVPIAAKPMNDTIREIRPTTAEEICEAYTDEVWRFVSSQVRNREDAEDVVMEVFQSAFAQLHKIRAADNQRLWLLGIARKKVSDSLRKRYRRREDPLHDGYTVEVAERSELHEAARGALRLLPEPQGEALVLKYVNGLSTEEVAQVLRRSLPATNSLLQRARAALREALKTKMPEPATGQV